MSQNRGRSQSTSRRHRRHRRRRNKRARGTQHLTAAIDHGAVIGGWTGAVKVLATVIAAVLLAVGGLSESDELKSTIVDETREIRRTLSVLTEGQKEIRDQQRRFDERLRAVEIEQKAEQRVKNQQTWQAAMKNYLDHIKTHSED